MKRRLLARTPSPAMLVAIFALVLSLTGGALAAALIDTGDIENGAVTKKKVHKNAVNSKKVKNKTLKAKDFAPGQLEQGVQGIQGLEGDKGDKGDTGARGPSDGFHAAADNSQGNGQAGNLDLALPAGSYIIVAKTGVSNNGGGTVDNIDCSLEPDLDVGFVGSLLNGREDQINLQGALTTGSSTTVTLSCGATTDISFLRMKVDAIQVGDLH
jgi:hypothetical protein